MVARLRFALLLVLFAAAPARAWLTDGHRRVAVAAVEALPADFPAFFRAGAATVGHLAVDPDFQKNLDTPELKAREEPEHYIDLERLEGRPLPATRTEYFRLMVELGRQPAEMGFLPYAVLEGAERLALCFAEHRRWPDNPQVREKCLVYAGLLAHYAADLDQPLHTTIHHDGWALPGGGSPLVGFHFRIDALIERVPLDAQVVLAGVDTGPFSDLRSAVEDELVDSHSRIDAAYRLETALATDAGWSDPEVVAFTCERYRRSTEFLARLFATAWRLAARLELPAWLRRESGALEPARPPRPR